MVSNITETSHWSQSYGFISLISWWYFHDLIVWYFSMRSLWYIKNMSSWNHFITSFLDLMVWYLWHSIWGKKDVNNWFNHDLWYWYHLHINFMIFFLWPLDDVDNRGQEGIKSEMYSWCLIQTSPWHNIMISFHYTSRWDPHDVTRITSWVDAMVSFTVVITHFSLDDISLT